MPGGPNFISTIEIGGVGRLFKLTVCMYFVLVYIYVFHAAILGYLHL